MQVGQPSESDENGQEKWYKVHEGERVSSLRDRIFDLYEVPTFMHYIWALHFILSIIDFLNELDWRNIWNMLDISDGF